MGDIRGFLKVKRENFGYRPVCERIKDFKPVCLLANQDCSKEQASRCMDCGTPFCHWGCPVGNYIPEWNDFMFTSHWQQAFDLLNATNNLPEITGRICPAPCEFACVLGINDDAVTVRENELAIIEYAFKAGLIKANPPKKRTGKKIAVIGSGPAGLSAASQLSKAGHKIIVFEKDDRLGGIMRYGIPDFKLEKNILDRRINLLRKEGIEFITNTNVGVDYKISKLKKEFDCLILAGGCRVARDLKIEGRNLSGIHFAMDYLMYANRLVAGDHIPAEKSINAKGKRVVVIGGGDTGSDCVGTAHRQGASCVIQIELLAKPSECRPNDMPWPKYPLILKTSTSHEEGGQRHWAVLTKKFIGEGGKVKKISCVKVEFIDEGRKVICPVMKEIPGSEFEIEADLVILAMGFIHPQKDGLLSELKLQLDEHSNIKTDLNYMTSVKGVFSAGDMRRGQSLIVWAISEGRRAAYSVDRYLMRGSGLPII
ncbi:MAG: glutamate synthase subunit beta [Candidatus Omnitrophota bacterium]